MNEGELTEPGQEGNECMVVGGSKQTANDEMKERRCGREDAGVYEPSQCFGRPREGNE